MSKRVLLCLLTFPLLFLFATSACTTDLGAANVGAANRADNQRTIEIPPEAIVSYATRIEPKADTFGLEAGPDQGIDAGSGPAGLNEEVGPNAGGANAGNGVGPGPAEAAGPGPQASFGPGPDCRSQGDCDPAEGEFGPGPNLEAGPGPDASLGPGPGCSECPGPTVQELTETDEAALFYMREEEKLAGDVYNVLHAQWGWQLFANIARSEQVHEASLLKLMALYGLEDPAAGNAPGGFNSPALQTLYEQMIARGTVSASEALRVGAAIEEIDIQDLYLQLDQTSNPDLTQTFTNLLRGSEHHLRTFVRALAQETGEIYVPQYLDPVAYTAIVGIIGAEASPGGNGRGPGPAGNTDD